MMIDTLVATLEIIPPGLLIALSTVGLIAAIYAFLILLPEEELSPTPDDLTDSHTEETP